MKPIEDERIIAEKRRINSKAFSISLLALWGMLLFRQFVLHQTIMEYIDIFLLTMGISIYITANNVVKGFYLTYRSTKTRKRVNFISAAVASISFVTVQFFVMKYDIMNLKDMLQLLVSFIIFFVFWITGQSILINISEAKASKEVE